MSDQKQQQKEPSNKEAPAKPEETGKGKSKSVFFGIIGLLSLGVLVAVALVGYFGYQQLLQMSDRLILIEQQEKNVVSETQQVKTALQKSLSQLQQQTQKQLQQLNADHQQKILNLEQQLATSQRQIKSFTGRHQNDWLLAEADYLVRIASNRLLLERDHITALALLLRAEQRLAMMDDPSMQAAREALSRDMAVLRSLKREDVAGIAIRITGLVPQLKALTPMSFQLPEQTKDVIDSPPVSAENNWQESLKQTFKELSVKWFEVRDHGQTVKPLMAPEKESLLRTNMMLLLQATQFATLRQLPELYQQSLLQLENLLQEHFDFSDPAVMAFAEEVKLLSAMTVRVELPKKLESRLILARLVEQRLQQPVAPVAINDARDEQQ